MLYFIFIVLKQEREEGNSIAEGVGLCHGWAEEEPGLRLENDFLVCLSFVCVKI